MQRIAQLTLLFTLSILVLAWAAPFSARAEPPAAGKTASAAPKARAKARKQPARASSAGKKKAARGRPAEATVPAAEQARAGIESGEGVESATEALREVGSVSGGTVDESENEQTAVGTGMRHSRHMEFDARLVRGETAGSGAVVLFDRGERQLPRLTRLRNQFLRATVEPVLGKRRAAEQSQARSSQSSETQPDPEQPAATTDGSGE